MALPLLNPVLLALICLTVAAGLTIMTLAAIQVLKDAPVIGGWIAGKAQALERTISGALGRAFSAIDHFIGAAIHLAARYVEEAVGEIRSHARLIAAIAAALVPIATAIHSVRNLAHGLDKTWRGIEHGIRSLTRVWHGIEHRVHAIEHDLSKGIGHDLRVRVRTLRHELDHVEHKTIPAIRSDVATADAAINNLYEWAKGKASLLGVGTFVAAVLAALGEGAWQLLRCNKASEIENTRGCSMWNALDDLLGLVALAVVAENFDTLVHEAQALTDDAVTVFDDVFGISR